MFFAICPGYSFKESGRCVTYIHLISDQNKPNRHFILSGVTVSLSNTISDPKNETPLAMTRGISGVVFLEQFICLDIKLI